MANIDIGLQNQIWTDGESIQVDTNIQGSISSADDFSYYKFEVPVTGLYTIETLDTDTTDTHGYLYDSAKLLWHNNNTWDNGVTKRNFRIFYALHPGQTYYLRVALAQNATGGPFTLKIIPPTDKELQYGALGWAWPTTSLNLTSYYGYRTYNGGEYHQGLDVQAGVGTPVYAVADGTIVWVGDLGTGGNTIIQKVAGVNGLPDAYIRYLHLDSFGSHIPPVNVQKGEPIALSGETGGVSGPHLHFDINFNGITTGKLHFADSINPQLFYVNLELDGQLSPKEPPV